MKALFLDIDGVLLPFGEGSEDVLLQDHSNSDVRFSLDALDALSSILEADPEIEIVLSSTWRCAGGDQAAFAAFDAYVQSHNPSSPLAAFAARGTFAHTTCPLNHSHRQWEIAEWLLTSPAAASITSWFTYYFNYPFHYCPS